MKKIIPLIFSGIFGGLVVLSGTYFLNVDHPQNTFQPTIATKVNNLNFKAWYGNNTF